MIVELCDKYDLGLVRKLILGSEWVNQQSNSYFLSVHWVTEWLNMLEIKPFLFKFYRDSKDTTPCAICFLGVKEVTRFPFKWKVAYLHQTGNHKEDQVWIEHNRILCEEADYNECMTVLCDFLFNSMSVSIFHASCLSFPVPQLGKVDFFREKSIFYSFCSTIANKTLLKDILNTLSRNTRYQIKKSIKIIESSYGGLELREAQGSKALLNSLELLGVHHKARWADTKDGSGFDNKKFISFHSSLIVNDPEHIHVLSLYAGKKIVGIGYYFSNDEKIYFYCSGINHDIATNSIKPGLMFHVCAMRHFAECGYKTYDFLAGDAQYKRSLSEFSYPMYTETLYSRSLYTRTFLTAKMIKRWLHGICHNLRTIFKN